MKNTATLFIICGLPASGKTTLAEKIIRKNSAFHLSEDEWIKDLINMYDNDEMRNNIAKLHIKIALRLLKKGVNIVMDGGYYSRKERDNLRNIAKISNAKFELHYLKTDFAILDARRISRNKSLKSQFWTTEKNLKKAVSFFEEPSEDEICILYENNNAVARTKEAPVILSEYNPEWVLSFEKEKDFLMNIIGKYLCETIEHVGSTSVSGLTAKPVIDIMFGVKSLEESKSAIDILNKNGYCYYPYKSDIMHWFCKPSPKFRTHHLHLIPYESDLWKERIKFRNILRANAQIANKYIKLKKELAESYKEDRETYTEKKGHFIQTILNNE